MKRRTFLQAAGSVVGFSLSLEAPGSAFGLTLGDGQASPSERIQVAVVGVRGRGNNLLRQTFRGDDDSNRFLPRAEYRAPWKLPAESAV